MPPARATAARRSAGPRPPAGATSRLDLLEALLMSRDAGQCAQRALTWLQRYAGVRPGLCLAADTAPPRLVPVAGLGVPVNRLERFSVDLEVRDHPLTQALLSSAPMTLGDNGHGGVPPLGPAPGTPRALPGGLRLISRLAGPAAPEARWLARVLGPRLAALMAARRVEEA